MTSFFKKKLRVIELKKINEFKGQRNNLNLTANN